MIEQDRVEQQANCIQLFTGMMQYLNDSCSFCDKYGSSPQVVDLDGASPDESDVGSHSRTKDT